MKPRARLYFLVKDPHWTFVWWELSAPSRDGAAGSEGRRGQLVLRVQDVTDTGSAVDDAPIAFDVPITGSTGHCYLYLPVSGRTYCVRLGFRSLAGDFHAVAGSNPLSLPPEGPSDRRDESWSTVPLRRDRWKKKAIC